LSGVGQAPPQPRLHGPSSTARVLPAASGEKMGRGR
jgi:hypothetical protein